MKQSNRCDVAGGLRIAWLGRGACIARRLAVLVLTSIMPWPAGALDVGGDRLRYGQFAPSSGPSMPGAAGGVERATGFMPPAEAAGFRPRPGPPRSWDEPVFRPWSAVSGSESDFRPRTGAAHRARAPQAGQGYAERYRDVPDTAAFGGDGNPYRGHDPHARAARYYPPMPGAAAPPAVHGLAGACSQRWPPPGVTHAPSAPVSHSWLWPLLAVDIPPPWLWSY